jgi:octaprenyl-diphosphate synthase
MHVTTANPSADASDLAGIEATLDPISADMKLVDSLIRERLHSDVVLVSQLGHYIINSGGKRLRPALALLSAHAWGYQGTQHINIAAIVEFIHTATLLHDDVVDSSERRRGQDTANLIWGNEASVLVGDFLYSRSFQMMVELDHMRIMEILSDATNTIAEGEVLQLVNCHNPDTSELRYMEIIRNKTAKLFEAACRLGAVISNRDKKEEEAIAAYGRHLGIAYQLIDDVLDYSASAEQLGKNIGDDLEEGKPTLPLLYAMWNGTAEQASLVREAIENGGRETIDQVMFVIESTGAIAYTSRLAREEARNAERALDLVPDTQYKTSLLQLAEFSVSRKS